MNSLMIGHDITAKTRTADVSFDKNVSFKDLFLSPDVLSGLNKAGFYHPSPIQLNAIPFGRCGLDLIVQAKSGTGKTCVFSVIALEAVITGTSTLQVVVLAPTREIAVQIASVLDAVGQNIKDLVVTCFIGGRPVSEDKVNAKGCHIAVGTPGRIFQLIQLGVLSCENVRLFVLDEADKLLEDNFQSQINSIYSVLPMNKQMIAASATYPDELAQFVTNYMQDPTFVRLNPRDMALLGIKQYIYEIPLPTDQFLSHFECKIKATVDLLEAYTFTQALVFSNYHSHAKDLSDACNSVGLSATFISGNLEQARRLEAIQLLKEYKCRVLISTDLTSRGIDASNVDLVVNLDVPQDWETYMHRTGRAGRFGSLGAVISVVMAGLEKADLLKITKSCNIPIFPISCVERAISTSTQPLKSMSREETHYSHRNVGASKPSPNSLGDSVQNNNRPGSQKEQEHTYRSNVCKNDISINDLASAPTMKENFPRQCKIPSIPSLPELMYGKNPPSKQSSISYASLIESYNFFRDHGTFNGMELRKATANSPTSNDSNHDDDLTLESNKLDDRSDAILEHRKAIILAKDSRRSNPEDNTNSHDSIKKENFIREFEKCGNHSTKNKGQSQCGMSHTSRMVISGTLSSKPASAEERSLKLKKSHVSPGKSQQTFSNIRHKTVSQSTVRKGKHRRGRSHKILHPVPIFLPRYTKSSNTVPSAHKNYRSIFEKQFISYWRSHYLTYLMWWNQYQCMQYWNSIAF